MALGAPALPSAAPAQSFSVRALASHVRTATDAASSDRRIGGRGIGLEAGVGIGRLGLTVMYLEGTLSNDSLAVTRDFAEGDLSLWVRPLRWAALGAGPHVRSWVAAGGTERWLSWNIRARGTTALLPDRINAYAEGWLAVSGDVDVPEPFNSGRGLEGGLELTLGRLPLGFRLRYRVERVGLGGGARRETTEHLMLGVGIGRL
jgi:hypothetical protein